MELVTARTRSPAVAVMAKVPGKSLVKSRLHAALTAERATELYRCFLLDRLDAVAALQGVSRVVAFTPDEAERVIRELAPPGFELVAQRGADLGERLSGLLTDLLARGHAGAIAIDSDSPTLPMTFVVEAATMLADARCDVVLGPSRGLGLTVHVLPRWFDVDTEGDLQRLHAELSAGSPSPRRTHAFVAQLYASGSRSDVELGA